MAVEIERKFLVKGDFRKDIFSSERIIQGYMVALSQRSVRFRIRGDRGYITIKGPGNETGTTRFEWEKEIPVNEVEELLRLADPGTVDKTRHLVRNTDGIHIWEVDEFHGDNEGLIVAEIELGSEDESFDRPDWLGDEVTGDARYYNSRLRLHPYKDW